MHIIKRLPNEIYPPIYSAVNTEQTIKIIVLEFRSLPHISLLGPDNGCGCLATSQLGFTISTITKFGSE